MRLRKRHHYSKDQSHTPYRNCLHHVDTDVRLRASDVFEELLADVPCGQAFEITVAPISGDNDGMVWANTEPHRYTKVERIK